MKKHLFYSVIIIVFSLLTIYTAKAQFSPFVIDGATNTYVTCINDSGDIGGYYDDLTGIHGFIYDGSDTIIIEYPGAIQTWVYGINNYLDVVGSYNTTGVNTDNEGFQRDITDTYVDLTTSWIPGMDITIARDINDAGCLVGDYKQSTTHVCFSMCGGNNSSFHYNYNPTYINSINETGKRAGFWIDGSNRHGLIYDYGNWTEIDYPGATRTMFTAINDSNIAVGIFNLTRSFMYSNGVFKEIKKWDATDFQIKDINNKGIVVGYFKDASNVYKGFYMPIWDIGFRPNPNGWSFENSTNNIWPQSWWKQFDYTYDPYLGGQSWFPKITYSDGSVDTINRRFFPDWPLFVEAVGENQCYYNSGEYRVLKGKAFLKYKSLLNWWGGSCFGFVQSSFMAWDSIQRFKAAYPLVGPWDASNKLYPLPLNDANRKCINHLMVKQNQSSYWNYRIPLYNIPPTTTLNALKAQFLDKSKNERGLTIRNQNGSGGHIVNPYKIIVDSIDSDIEYIYIYDNNWPNDSTRIIKVDKFFDSWWYNLAANAGVAPEEWGGQNANRGIFLSWPVRDWYATPNIDSIANSKVWGEVIKSNNIEIYNSSGCDFSITDGLGQVTGYMAGQVLENIPGSIAMIPESGTSQVPYGYLLPEASYSIRMNGFSNTGAYCNILSNTNNYSYSRPNATLAQEDNISIGTTGMNISNTDNITKTVSLNTIFENAGNEMNVDVLDLAMSTNSNVSIVPVNANSVKLYSTAATTTYKLNVRYINNTGEANFTNNSITLIQNCAQIITPDWNNLQTQNVTIFIDCGNNGSIDDTLYFGNQQAPAILTSIFELNAPAAAETDTIYITNSGGGNLNWSVVSNSTSWLTITSASSGTNDGFFKIGIAANSGAARTGTLTITDAIASNSPYTIVVNQEGVMTAPSNVIASDGNYSDGVHILWDAVSGATHYMLYRSDNAGSNGSAITGWITPVSYIDSTALNGKFYYYSAKAAQDASGLNATDYSTMDDGWRSCFTADFSYSGICTGQPTLLEDNSSVHSAVAYYLWDINNDGSIEYIGSSISHTFTSNGTYSVNLIVTDSSLCADTMQKTVTILAFPDINLPNDTILCSSQNIILDAGNGFNSYLWSTGATTQSITIDSTGYGLGTFSIYVQVSNANGCSTIDTTFITWTPCTEIDEPANKEFAMNIYPNPANGLVNITVNGLDSDADLKIFNINGQFVFAETIENTDSSWTGIYNFNEFHKGIYFVRIVTNDRVVIGKVVIY